MEKPKPTTGHTPGPWHVCGHYIRGEGDAYICDIKFPVEGDQEIAADARLIAAAPELLEALKALLADIQEYQRINLLGGENNHSQVQARAAIRKAESGR